MGDNRSAKPASQQVASCEFMSWFARHTCVFALPSNRNPASGKRIHLGCFNFSNANNSLRQRDREIIILSRSFEKIPLASGRRLRSCWPDGFNACSQMWCMPQSGIPGNRIQSPVTAFAQHQPSEQGPRGFVGQELHTSLGATLGKISGFGKAHDIARLQ